MEELNAMHTTDSIKEDRCWCVYMHTNMINNKIYVGITSNSVKTRWGKNGSQYRKTQPAFYRAIRKYGWDNFEHIIFADGLSEDDAKHMEILLIALYKTNCNRYKNPVCGYNLTDGGEGCSGMRHSIQTKEKLSQIAKERFSDPTNHPNYGKDGLKGKDNPMYGVPFFDRITDEGYKQWHEHHIPYWNGRKGQQVRPDGQENYWKGKHLTEEAKGKLRIKALERYADKTNHPSYGKRCSEEAKQKIRDSKKNGNGTVSKPIYCIELKQCFYSASNASEVLNIDASAIGKCARGNKYNKSAGKHPDTKEKLHWLYAENAIRDGYITQQDLDNYLQEIRNKGDNDNED